MIVDSFKRRRKFPEFVYLVGSGTFRFRKQKSLKTLTGERSASAPSLSSPTTLFAQHHASTDPLSSQHTIKYCFVVLEDVFGRFF